MTWATAISIFIPANKQITKIFILISLRTSSVKSGENYFKTECF